MIYTNLRESFKEQYYQQEYFPWSFGTSSLGKKINIFPVQKQQADRIY